MRLILALVMLVFPAFLFGGTERVDLLSRIQVDVLSKDKHGDWSVRKGTFHMYSDARIVVCVEHPDSLAADCLLITDDGEVIFRPEALLEEKI